MMYQLNALVRLFLLLVCGFMTSVVSAKEWQMPVANPMGHYQTQLAIKFAGQVKQATQGRVDIKVYASGHLFKGEQIFGAVRNDLVPIGARLMSALEHESKVLQLDALPFLTMSFLDAFKLYRASRPEIESILRGKGVKLLYAVPWPAQGLYTKRKISAVADLKTLRFRPYSEMTSVLGEALNMEHVVMAKAKVGAALKRGKIDVLFGSALLAKDYNVMRSFKYWYDLKAWQPKEMVVVNLQQWSMLSSSDRASIVAVAKKIEAAGWAKSKQESEVAKQRLVQSRISVEPVSEALVAELKEVGFLLARRWLDNVGDKGRYLLERYVNQ